MIRFAEGRNTPYEQAIPAPAGWRFLEDNAQLQLAVAAADLPRYRYMFGKRECDTAPFPFAPTFFRFYSGPAFVSPHSGFAGYIGEAKSSKTTEDTSTPLRLQVVAKLPYRFGKTEAETKDSHIFVRVNAFASRACLDKSFDCVKLGSVVCGIWGNTSSTYHSAQLVGSPNGFLWPPPHVSSLIRYPFPHGPPRLTPNGTMRNLNRIGITA